MLELKIHEQNIETVIPKDYTRGTIGAQVKIVFDDFWADYEKTVVFKRCNSLFSKPVPIFINTMNAIINIPPEILVESGKYQIGVIGIKDGIVLPTLYSDEFNCLYATDTKGLKSADEYTPSEIDQLRLSKQDKLKAGSNITIKDNIISVEGLCAPNWNQNNPTQPDYINNRTHYMDKAFEDITWDGDTTDRIFFPLGNEENFFKVSDYIPTIDELNGGEFYLTTSEGEVVPFPSKLDPSFIDEGVSGCFIIADLYVLIIYSIDNFREAAAGEVPENLTNGTYFMHYGSAGEYISKLKSAGMVKKLDEEYLPDISVVAKTGSYKDLKDKPEIYECDEIDDKFKKSDEKSDEKYETKTDASAKLNEATTYASQFNSYVKVAGKMVALTDLSDTNFANVRVLNNGKPVSNVEVILSNEKPLLYDKNRSFNGSPSALVFYFYKRIKDAQNTSRIEQVDYTYENGVVILSDFANEFSWDGGIGYSNLELEPNTPYYLNLEYDLGYNAEYGYYEVYMKQLLLVKKSNNERVVKTNSVGQIKNSELEIPYTFCAIKDNSLNYTISAKYLLCEQHKLMSSVDLKLNEISKGYPLPFNMTSKDKLNVVRWNGRVAISFSSTATGTKDDPIIISTAEELAYLCKGADGNTAGKYYKIADEVDVFDMDGMRGISINSTVNDVSQAVVKDSNYEAVINYDILSKDWSIVYRDNTDESVFFAGVLDGNGAIICNLYGKALSMGLFPRICESADGTTEIKNLIIKSCKMVSTGTNFNDGAGAIFGTHSNYNHSNGFKISNCAVIDCCLEGDGYVSAIGGNIRWTNIHIDNCLIVDNKISGGDVSSGGLIACSQGISNKKYYVTNSIILGTKPYPEGTFVKESSSLDFSYFTSNDSYNNVYSDDTTIDTSKYKNISTLTRDKMVGKSATNNINLDWQETWFVSDNFQGEQIPFDYLQFINDCILGKINDIPISKLSSFYTYSKVTLGWNSLYIIQSSGSADIRLYNSATGSIVIDTAGEELPASQLCVLILPKENSVDITSAGKEKPTTTKRCLYVGITGKFSLLNPDVIKSKQFLIGDGDLYFTPTSSGASVWKIAL